MVNIDQPMNGQPKKIGRRTHFLNGYLRVQVSTIWGPASQIGHWRYNLHPRLSSRASKSGNRCRKSFPHRNPVGSVSILLFNKYHKAVEGQKQCLVAIVVQPIKSSFWSRDLPWKSTHFTHRWRMESITLVASTIGGPYSIAMRPYRVSDTLWLCQIGYWKWPVVDLPIKDCDFP